MTWTERQQAMLKAMGLSVWVPPASSEDGAMQEAAQGGSHVATPPVGAPAVAEAPPPVRRASAPVSAPAPAPVHARTGAPTPIEPESAGEVPVPIVAHGVAALDWAGLRAAVKDCRACALCEGRKQTVFGVGNERAHWMIVGEAPGEQEDIKGEPFVGPAGQLLDQMLRALGLTRSAAAPEQQVFIANTLKCRPPRNRNPEPSELAQCEPFLRRQLALVQPRVILAMGRFAVQSLLRSDDAIGRLRGRVHRYEGVPLIVTYHPAYLLRQPADKAKAWEDLCLAASLIDKV